ncbi:hypothetical protein MNEG_12714 [Monoraphidium neglectum]|uniref:Pyruvate kinase n=1 Tax=Monoraphidium neglectum TaxID=145388 RepID=A0A0D2KHI7_9CHLO|nr:hypothetical protein MNEG_12714 [Monoraphidium neglectum]KIY95248.1 hypothetical protein MNEG_12714 [Monoraphidium neglectum]|eukprot:XP_013894268.1 hypothetical protein MNEG_12714 [Monoraphidium neglectum]
MALIQKSLIQTCNLVGKPVIITRVMDSMAVTPRPTRAEATDVANAVLDGADGILLGQETLRGTYPVEVIDMLSSICKMAEKVFDHHYHFDHLMDTAQAVEDWEPPGTTPPGAATPADGSTNDLPGLGGQDAGHTQHDNNHHQSRKQGNGLQRTHSSESYSSLTLAVKAMTRFGPSSRIGLDALNHSDSTQKLYAGSPYLSKLESIASGAVRAADKVKASLIVVYTHTGKTAQLVAKYRPPMPILTLVVPRLVSDSLKWRLEGKHNARQCLLTRGLLPMLATPQPNGDAILEEAIAVAAGMGIVKANDHVVAVQRVHEDFCVKIITIDPRGRGIKPIIFTELQEQARAEAWGASLSFVSRPPVLSP